MKPPQPLSGEQLAGALLTLGVRFVLGDGPGGAALAAEPARLLAALAQSTEARLRLALIPLLLHRPELAVHARRAAAACPPAARLTLQCYYTAAVWLAAPGHLPDLFSPDLQLSPGPDPQQNLTLLALRHRELSGAPINWLGTYQHAAALWRRAEPTAAV